MCGFPFRWRKSEAIDSSRYMIYHLLPTGQIISLLNRGLSLDMIRIRGKIMAINPVEIHASMKRLYLVLWLLKRDAA